MNTKIHAHVKVGDRVKIITGAQKGVLGNVSSISTKKKIVIIDTVSPRIKFIKNRESKESTKIELQIPISVSNVMLWDKEANTCSKVGHKLVNLKKVRYFKKSGNIL